MNTSVHTYIHTYIHTNKFLYIAPKSWKRIRGARSERGLSHIPSWSFRVWLVRQAPAYLADDCQLTFDVSTRRLRSTDTPTCVIRRYNNSFSDRCFAAAGPRLWNTLPTHLRLCDSLEQFKRLLKTHLFGVWDRGALWRLVGAPCINLLTSYLHRISMREE